MKPPTPGHPHRQGEKRELKLRGGRGRARPRSQDEMEASRVELHPLCLWHPSHWEAAQDNQHQRAAVPVGTDKSTQTVTESGVSVGIQTEKSDVTQDNPDRNLLTHVSVQDAKVCAKCAIESNKKLDTKDTPTEDRVERKQMAHSVGMEGRQETPDDCHLQQKSKKHHIPDTPVGRGRGRGRGRRPLQNEGESPRVGLATNGVTRRQTALVEDSQRQVDATELEEWEDIFPYPRHTERNEATPGEVGKQQALKIAFANKILNDQSQTEEHKTGSADGLRPKIELKGANELILGWLQDDYVPYESEVESPTETTHTATDDLQQRIDTAEESDKLDNWYTDSPTEDQAQQCCCHRPQRLYRCNKETCDNTFKGRLHVICPVHPGEHYLMDSDGVCTKCRTGRYVAVDEPDQDSWHGGSDSSTAE